MSPEKNFRIGSKADPDALIQAMKDAVDLAAYREAFPSAEALLRSDGDLAEPYIDAAVARFPDARRQVTERQDEMTADEAG